LSSSAINNLMAAFLYPNVEVWSVGPVMLILQMRC
jgi:hypothetical protein